MISELHYKILDNANREFAARFEELRIAGASRDNSEVLERELRLRPRRASENVIGF